MPKKMKMPGMIRIGYKDVSVIKTPLITEDHAGLFRHGVDAQILIAEEQEGVELADTAVHELLHAVWRYYGLTDNVSIPDDVEEQVVSVLAHGLVQVMRDNPEFIDWLREQMP